MGEHIEHKQNINFWSARRDIKRYVDMLTYLALRGEMNNDNNLIEGEEKLG